MKTGQFVRIRPTSPLARQFRFDADAQGVVLCQYKVLAKGPSCPERLDVQLPNGRVAWGVPADAFEAIDETRPPVLRAS